MMNEERWATLRETFDNEANFEAFTEEGWTTYWYTTGIPGNEGIAADLFDWLECSCSSPSYAMIKEFHEHGYNVRAGERDSFGWLTGIVHDNVTGRNICFG